MKVFLKILMWIAIVAVVILIVMWLSVQISDELDTIPDLIDYLIEQYRSGGSTAAQVLAPRWR